MKVWRAKLRAWEDKFEALMVIEGGGWKNTRMEGRLDRWTEGWMDGSTD